jgi:hypothetical protein
MAEPAASSLADELLILKPEKKKEVFFASQNPFP